MSFDLISNWNLVRASGFLAYFLLTFSIAAGLLPKISAFKNNKPLMMELHKFSGWTGVLTVLFHGVLLLFNHYVPYEIDELLIPFEADFAPVLSGIGTISFYLFLIVMLTSDFFMNKLGFKLWKKIHFLVIPAWIFMILHSIFIGTDSKQPWAIMIYLIGIVIISGLLIFRFFGQLGEAGNKNTEKTAP